MDPASAKRRNDATACLQSLSKGSPEAAERLLHMLHADLRRIAASHLRNERVDHTLQPTALVHEAWMRLIDQDFTKLEDRGHFLRLASRAMRNVLVDHARARLRLKRGAGKLRVELEDVPGDTDSAERAVDVLAVHEALERLRTESDDLAALVEMRFFGGLTMEEIAGVMGRSRASLFRDWRLAQALLTSYLRNEGQA